jgi:GDPmannose 4,6-dehydratase
VDFLLGDSTKAKTELGWSPTIGFDQLVHEMVDADCGQSLANVHGATATPPQIPD